jgi:F-box domain
MSVSTLGSRSSLFPIPEKQLLPNETLTSVLAEMEPWDAWPLRLVSKNFNSYILRVLAPRFYVPGTYVYIRSVEVVCPPP